MKIKKGLPGYPILMADDDDYIDSYYDAKLDYEKEFNQLSIELELSLKNDKLKEMIDDGSASYVIHFECPLLSFRDYIETNDAHAKRKIDMNRIADSLEVSTYIVAKRNLEKYRNEKFNWAFGDEGFDISKGNILAIGPSYTIEVDRAKDGLRKLPDVIQIKEYDNDDRKEIMVILDGPIITIMVSKLVKDIYFNMGKGEYFNTILSMIMIPAMIQVLTNMKENEDGYSGYAWYKVIEKLLNQNGISVEQLDVQSASGKYSVYEIAQKIFKSPIEKGFIDLKKASGERC